MPSCSLRFLHILACVGIFVRAEDLNVDRRLQRGPSWLTEVSYFDQYNMQNVPVLTIEAYKIRVLPLLETDNVACSLLNYFFADANG